MLELTSTQESYYEKLIAFSGLIHKLEVLRSDSTTALFKWVIQPRF